MLGFDDTSIQVGMACCATQVIFYALFTCGLLPKGPWSKEPGFTAHQIVCLPLMIYLAIVGWQTWFTTGNNNEGYETPTARVSQVHVIGKQLSGIIFCQLVIWDIPTGLATKSLRQPEMIVHHILMAILAYMSFKFNMFTYYTPLYFGFIELSGVPLAIVDFTNPKHKAWCSWFQEHPIAATLPNVCRPLFAVLYFVCRLFIFPYYMFSMVLPDIVSLLSEGGHGMQSPLVVVGVFAVLLTLLQFYWGWLIFQQVVKMFSAKEKKRE